MTDLARKREERRATVWAASDVLLSAGRKVPSKSAAVCEH